MNIITIILVAIILILFVVILGFLIDLKGYIAGKFKQKSFAQAQIMRSFDRKNKELLIDKLSLKLKYAIDEVEDNKEQWISKNELLSVLKAMRTDLKKELNSDIVDTTKLNPNEN